MKSITATAGKKSESFPEVWKTFQIICKKWLKLKFEQGVPDKNNFDKYRILRMKEAPKEIETLFVENQIDPTGLGEPGYPSVFAALVNALYKAPN